MISTRKVYYAEYHRKKNLIAKSIALIILLLGMIGYIFYMTYLSEPKFENNRYGKPNTFDYISVYYKEGYSEGFLEGIVVQTDTSGFAMRYSSGLTDLHFKSGIYSFPYNQSNRILGKGTFYHKANAYVGFNIMITSVIFILILFIVLLTSLIKIINEILF